MVADALLLVSYGSPECRNDVLPFLKNLLQGRDVSPAILEKAVAQYNELALQTGQFSPLAQQCRLLVAKLSRRNSLLAPLYWGNLFWHPLLSDTLTKMSADGVQQAFAFITSPFDSEISRKRYITAIKNAQNDLGPNAPKIQMLPAFGNHPLYYRAVADRILEPGDYLETAGAKILFTAHSLPLSDSGTEQYTSQLNKAASEVLSLLPKPIPWELVFQSRSGKPSDPWLEPDICVRIRQLAQGRDRTGQSLSLIIVPIGFLLENKETVYDLDLQVMSLCDELRIRAFRVGTAGVSSTVLEMIEQMAK